MAGETHIVNYVMRNGRRYNISAGAKFSGEFWGDGHDGCKVIPANCTCYMCAKEYDFISVSICPGAKLMFCGEGVPVFRTKCFINCGCIDLRKYGTIQYDCTYTLPYSLGSVTTRCGCVPSVSTNYYKGGNGGGGYYSGCQGGGKDEHGCGRCTTCEYCGKTYVFNGCGGKSCCGNGGGGGVCGGYKTCSSYSRMDSGGFGVGGDATETGGGNGANGGGIGYYSKTPATGGGGGGYGHTGPGGNGGNGGSARCCCGANGGDGGGSMCYNGGNGGDGGSNQFNSSGTDGGNGGDSYYGNGGRGGNGSCSGSIGSNGDTIWYGVGGRGGNSWCGNGGTGGCGGGGGGRGGNSYYGNGGNGGNACCIGSSCRYDANPGGDGGHSVVGNGGQGGVGGITDAGGCFANGGNGGRGGDTGYGNGGTGGTGGCSHHCRNCNCTYLCQIDGANGGDGGNATGGMYSLIVQAQCCYYSACIYGKGGNGGNGGAGGCHRGYNSYIGCRVNGGNGGNAGGGACVLVIYGNYFCDVSHCLCSGTPGAGGAAGTPVEATCGCCIGCPGRAGTQRRAGNVFTCKKISGVTG